MNNYAENSTLLYQVMQLGMQLLMAKQVSGLLPVLRLAGAVSEDPALQFLKVRSTRSTVLTMQHRSSAMNGDQPGWTARRQHTMNFAGLTQQSEILQAVVQLADADGSSRRQRIVLQRSEAQNVGNACQIDAHSYVLCLTGCRGMLPWIS